MNKRILLSILSLFFAVNIQAQNSLVRLDAESGRFKNLDYLPCCSKLTVEGEISKDVVLAELTVAYEGTDKIISESSWRRTINNSSETYEIRLREALAPNTSYDFSLKTFTKLTETQKESLKKNTLNRLHQFLKQEITIHKNKIHVESPRRVFKDLNTILESAIFYQRSLNGIKFNGLSDLVKQELYNMDDFSLKGALKKKKRDEKYTVTNKILNEKINGLVELVYSEIFPFLSSDLVQQVNEISINGVDTEKLRSTLPVNAGVYGYTTSQNFDNLSGNNSGILPGVGITIPFTRPFKVKNYKVGEFGLSFGVLLQTIKTQSGNEYGIPGLKFPLYAGLGFKTLKVVRINAGTIFATDLANPSKLKLVPTLGINIELNLWLGTKRY